MTYAITFTEKELVRMVTATRQRAQRCHYLADEWLARGAAGASAAVSYRAEGNAFDALAESLLAAAVMQGFRLATEQTFRTEGSSDTRAA